jgi:hypothetical protein
MYLSQHLTTRYNHMIWQCCRGDRHSITWRLCTYHYIKPLATSTWFGYAAEWIGIPLHEDYKPITTLNHLLQAHVMATLQRGLAFHYMKSMYLSLHLTSHYKHMTWLHCRVDRLSNTWRLYTFHCIEPPAKSTWYGHSAEGIGIPLPEDFKPVTTLKHLLQAHDMATLQRG